MPLEEGASASQEVYSLSALCCSCKLLSLPLLPLHMPLFTPHFLLLSFSSLSFSSFSHFSLREEKGGKGEHLLVPLLSPLFSLSLLLSCTSPATTHCLACLLLRHLFSLSASFTSPVLFSSELLGDNILLLWQCASACYYGGGERPGMKEEDEVEEEKEKKREEEGQQLLPLLAYISVCLPSATYRYHLPTHLLLILLMLPTTSGRKKRSWKENM